MSESNGGTVLYDAPGPRARRRYLVASVIALALFAVVLAVVLRRLAAQGQFSQELWGPLIDPRNEAFSPVWRLIGIGLRNTLVAAALAITFSLALGTALAVGRIMSGRLGRLPLVGFIELLRGLPLVITIYFASRVLPELHVNLAPLPGADGLWYLVIGLTLYNMVIVAEIVRTGVAALPTGQREAGLAIGLSGWQTMRLILLPQAFRIMLPALISQLVVILKDTSLGGLLGIYTELLRQGVLIAQNLSNPMQMFFVTGAIFVLINLALSRVAQFVDRRLALRGGGTRRPTGELAADAGAEVTLATP